MERGKMMERKDEAISSAAYECCKFLKENGSLDNHLFPIEMYANRNDELLPEELFVKEDERDPIYIEKLKRLIPVLEKNSLELINKTKWLYPLADFNPFEVEFEFDYNADAFIGYIYQMIFVDKNGKQLTENQKNSIGFVYHKPTLDSYEETVNLPFESDVKCVFNLVDKLFFTKETYTSFLLYYVFFECAVRSWDAKFYEYINSNEMFGTKRFGIKKVGQEINFSNIWNKKDEPKFCFCVILDRKKQIDVEIYVKIQKYTSLVSGYFTKLNEYHKTMDEKVEKKEFQRIIKKFKIMNKNENWLYSQKNSSQWIFVQNIINLHKYKVEKKEYLSEIDIMDEQYKFGHEHKVSYLSRMIFFLENIMHFTINEKEQLFHCRSLRQEISRQIKNSKMNYAERKNDKVYYGLACEYLEYPVQIELLLEFKRLGYMFTNLRDTLRIIGLKEKLIKLEEESNKNLRNSYMLPSIKFNIPLVYQESKQISDFLLGREEFSFDYQRLSEIPKRSEYMTKDWKYIDENERNKPQKESYSRDLKCCFLKSALTSKSYDVIFLNISSNKLHIF